VCRLYGFRANEETKVECTLARAQNALMIQSKADLRGLSHVDGWGIGYYPNGTPSVDRRATAAHQDIHFARTAERVYSRTVVAHVRRATVGKPLLENTHPFTHGRWLFAHNGTVTGWEEVRPRMEAEVPEELFRHRRGSTDSELAFYWLLARLGRAGIPIDRPAADLEALVRLLAGSVNTLAGWCRLSSDKEPRLNFVLTDGVCLVASRWGNTLCWVERHGVHDCEICGIPHVRHAPGFPYRAVVLGSEPISHEQWQAAPEQSVLSVDSAVRVAVQAL
jgi:glutamine amidotransferase